MLQPEDAAKDVNLKPAVFFVASTASQRQFECPTRPDVPMQKTGRPPVVIVSYGSSSTPTAANFHHGLYALAQPDAAARVQQVRPAAWSGKSVVTTVCHASVLYTQLCLIPLLTAQVACMLACEVHTALTYQHTRPTNRSSRDVCL